MSTRTIEPECARSHRIGRALALVLALCACTSARREPPPVAPATKSELEQRLARLVDDVEAQRVALHVPGLALAVVRDGKLVLAHGFGLADLENQRPVTPDTLFCIGSTTKAFTATLVGMLADEGKLSFDDPVTRFLPWFQLPIQGPSDTTRAPDSVTLRDLLAHRTGFGRMDLLWYGGRASPALVLRTALRAEPMAPFRKRFLYNNVMFLAAGEVCAAVAGEPWEQLVRERFFEPLGMSESLASSAAAARSPLLARGYDWEDGPQAFRHRPMRDLAAIAPAGAIHSSASDMARWVRLLLSHGALDGRRIVSEETLRETWTAQNSLEGGVDYGLGWFVRRWEGELEVDHGGNIDGYAAQVALLPDAGLGVVLLANVSATPLQGAIGPLTFRALLGPLPSASGESDGRAAVAEELERFTGTFIGNFFQFHDARFQVVVREGRLAVDIPGQRVFELGPPGSDGKRPFADMPGEIQVAFEQDERGQIVLMKMYQSGLRFELPRLGHVPPPEIPLAELEPYIGRYADPLSGKTFAVVVHDNRLAVDYPDQMVYELFPPDAEGRWVFRATDQLSIEFETDGDDQVEAVLFHERGIERICPREVTEALPTIEEVIALRRSDAFEARLAELGTCRLHGTVRFVHCGAAGTVTTTFEAGPRFREATDLSPFASTTTTFDGERAWFSTTLEPFQELTGESLDQARTGDPAVFFGDWTRRFERARVTQVKQAEGRRLLVVELTLGEAPPLTVQVDAESGDVVRAEARELVTNLGGLPKTVSFEDWRDVQGLRLPMRVVTEDDTTGRVVVEYQELETGLQLGDEAYRIAAGER